MTIQKILNSIEAIQKIEKLNLPIQKAYKIYNLKKQVIEKQEFFNAEIKKLIEKFNAKVEENGRITFVDKQSESDFAKEYYNLLMFETEEFASVVELSFSDLGDEKFSSADIAALEGFINFIE